MADGVSPLARFMAIALAREGADVHHENGAWSRAYLEACEKLDRKPAARVRWAARNAMSKSKVADLVREEQDRALEALAEKERISVVDAERGLYQAFHATKDEHDWKQFGKYLELAMRKHGMLVKKVDAKVDAKVSATHAVESMDDTQLDFMLQTLMSEFGALVGLPQEEVARLVEKLESAAGPELEGEANAEPDGEGQAS